MSKKNKEQRSSKPRSVRWLRVILWAFLGWMYTVCGLGTSSVGANYELMMLTGDIIGLLYGIVRFMIELNILRHPAKPKEDQVREYQIVGLSLLGFIFALVTTDNLLGGYFFSLMVPVFAALVAGIGINWQLHRPVAAPDTDIANHPMSKKLAEHYEEAGLSDSEIAVFRETMAGASKNVHQLENTVNNTVELQDILREFDTMNVIHAYFKAIVNEPKRMTEAAPFLYEQLPNMADLTHKYQIITRHEVKTSDTYLVLNQAKDALAKLAATIRDEYAAFIRDDLEDLDTTVTLTKQQLARHQAMNSAKHDSEEKEEN